MNKVIKKTKAKPKLNLAFKIDGQEICDPMEIGNKFCQYFTNNGSNLAKRITSAVLSSHTDHLSKKFHQSVFFNSAIKEEFRINIASSFKSGKAAEHDEISISTIN